VKGREKLVLLPEKNYRKTTIWSPESKIATKRRLEYNTTSTPCVETRERKKEKIVS
jgi:hypothetical protein